MTKRWSVGLAAVAVMLWSCMDVDPMAVDGDPPTQGTTAADSTVTPVDSTTVAHCPAGLEDPYVWSSVSTEHDYETDDGNITRSHAIAFGLSPATDTLCNPWRWSTRPQQVNAVIPGISVIKDIVGRFTDATGQARVTRHDEAWTGYTLETPVGMESDRWEGIYLDCASELEQFPLNRRPDTRIDVTIHYVVQYAERNGVSPWQVRPQNRRDSVQVKCPLPGRPVLSVTQDGNNFRLSIFPIVDAALRPWRVTSWSVNSTATYVDADGVTQDATEGWLLIPGSADLTSVRYRVRCSPDLEHDLTVTVAYDAGRAARAGGTSPASVQVRKGSGTFTYNCPAAP